MKRTIKQIIVLCALLCLLAVLAGCGYDNTVEDLFTLPRVPDEYTGLSQQLDQLLANGYEYAPPTVGQNIQEVQMEDIDSDGMQEAIVFLRRADDPRPLKIVVFKNNGEGYEQLCTMESSGSGIDSVYYEDLTGDGRQEIVVGWKISSTVQTLTVYSMGREAVPLMSSSYTRFTVQELNSYTPQALFLLRTDTDGNPVAEVYTWKTNILAMTYRCGLSSTMTDLGRGSVVKGTLVGGKPAVFITGVNDDGMAVTDILSWELSVGVTNLAADAATGKTTVEQPYRQLIPQDMNDDGVTEIPFPDHGGTGNDTLTDWMQYDRNGKESLAAQTYYCSSGGWYFLIPDAWHNHVSAEMTETVTGENQVTLSVDGDPVLALYTITTDNRESRLELGERFLLLRQTGTLYAAELLDAAGIYDLDRQAVKDGFHMAVTAWVPSDR